MANMLSQKQNGYNAIKEKLDDSKTRLHNVKFGIPFEDTCVDIRAKYAKNENSGSSKLPDQVDWEHLKVDKDRQAYFTNLYDKFLRENSETGIKPMVNDMTDISQQKKARSGPGFRLEGMADVAEDEVPLSMDEIARQLLIGPYASNKDKKKKRKLQSGIARHASKANIGKTKLAASADNDKSEKAGRPNDSARYKSRASSRPKDDSSPTEKFFKTRDQTYERKSRLNYLLEDNLFHMEVERKDNFERKFKAFSIGKNTIYVDDLSAMRQKAAIQKRSERSQLIRNHPWYHDLLNKVVNSGGIKLEKSETEQLLISKIKSVIEDRIPFDHTTFVQLLKLIPVDDFPKDEIQRIVRFVRQHGNISEREYLDAVEVSGHVLFSI
ncbi:uncharacterized protein BJ171DRAFT_515542 [Polychytrium aggregatum]|uniref:uncharacterized protein n=1 Tax=Polychytrium aggregatum TaxID=110093 RepID=UPI0022FF37A5|nr:uncharacterized protein BJ171DRAFT_515542 [Polychytrium aggregatum]KAI9202042.1 hypothetical protein BJ171DRAFT_515542 [Polychytrium aggregatum]